MGRTKIMPAIFSMLAVIWTISLLLFIGFESVQIRFWISFGFGILSFLLAIAGLFAFQGKKDRNTVEISMSRGYAAAVYVIISVIFNLCMAIPVARLTPALPLTGLTVALPLAVNLLLIIAFFVACYGISKYETKTAEMARKSAQRVEAVISVSREIASLASASKDAQIKQRLLKLKELVDYSTNNSSEVTEYYENEFASKFAALRSNVLNGGKQEETMQMIDEMETTWKMRNTRIR